MTGTIARKRGLEKVYFASCDVVLSESKVVQPDLLFVSNKRTNTISSDNIQGAPDLVVEILSPPVRSAWRE